MKKWLLLFLTIFTSQHAQGCATVTAVFDSIKDQLAARSGADIHQESAVIIWDDSQHIEHFIRTASLSTRAPSLGFLVPTPEVPELVEVDPAILQMADDVIAPRPVPPRKHVHLFYHAAKCVIGLASFDMSMETSITLGQIESQLLAQSIKEQDVAGYHATVLDAENVTQLKNWLLQNKFAWSDEDAAWLEPYVRKHWKITAFHLINPNPEQEGFQTRLVCMSFHTEKPFFPYSEPQKSQSSSQAQQPYRELKLTILSNNLLSGKLEDGSIWPAELRYAGSSIPDPTITTTWQASQWLSLAKLDGAMKLPQNMVTYRDSSSPRRGTSDLFFDSNQPPAPFQATRPDFSLPVIYTWQPSDAFGILFAGLVAGSFVYTAFRCSQKSAMLNTNASTCSPLVRRADVILPIFCLLFGFFFSLGLCFVPLPFFARAYSAVRHEPGKDSQSLFSSLPAQLCSIVLLCCAVIYLFLLYQHIGWGEADY